MPGVSTLEILGLTFNPFNRTLQSMRMLLIQPDIHGRFPPLCLLPLCLVAIKLTFLLFSTYDIIAFFKILAGRRVSFLFIYYVQPGDTLYQIARRYNTTVQRLLEINNLSDPDTLTVGMKLNIDAPAAGEAGEGAESGDPYVARLFDGILHILAADRLRYSRGEPVRLSLLKILLPLPQLPCITGRASGLILPPSGRGGKCGAGR